MQKQRMIVIGCGGMGKSHLETFQASGRVDVTCVVDRDADRARACAEKFNVPRWGTDAMAELARGTFDLGVVATTPSQHAGAAIAAMERGLHVYCEKPTASSLADSQAMMDTARRTDRKLFIGHQLRYMEPFMTLVNEVRGGLLGFPIVMRMAGNQQTFDAIWETQKGLLRDTSPLVDCGTHYVNIMMAMNPSRPRLVSAMGTSIARDVAWPAHYNYGLLQVKFEDGSVGHYEAGWGPMMTKNAWYIKDFSGPKGSLSYSVELDHNTPDNPPTRAKHTRHYRTIVDTHYASVQERTEVVEEAINKEESLVEAHRCFLDAVDRDLDVSDQLMEAHRSLEVVLAADRSVREDRMIAL